jgi:hypothetical protein
MVLFIIMLITPLIAGVFLMFRKDASVLTFTDNFYGRLIRRRRKILHKKGWTAAVSKYTLEPVLSIFIMVNNWTRDIKGTGLKSGLRVGGYLYVTGFFLFGIVTIVYFPFILAFAAAGILTAIIVEKIVSEKVSEKKVKNENTFRSRKEPKTFLETFWPIFKYRPTKENVERLFRLNGIDVDIRGNVFSADRHHYTERTKVGLVDKQGCIYDIRHSFPKKLGRVDDLGNVYEEDAPPHRQQEFN